MRVAARQGNHGLQGKQGHCNLEHQATTPITSVTFFLPPQQGSYKHLLMQLTP